MSGLEGCTRLEGLDLSPEALSVRLWEWGPLDGGAYARHVRLLPDGRVAGKLSQSESFWAVRDGQLVLLDRFDVRSSVFDEVWRDPDGRTRFVARSHAPGGAPHVLREVPRVGRICPAAEGVDPISRGDKPRRPYLVIVRAGAGSRHHGWERRIAEEDRNWDLCVSVYGGPFPSDDWSEHQVLQENRRKLPALHQLLHEASPLWAYDYIALPDDDVHLNWRDWNELFATCREFGLDLAQPGLSPVGHVTHPITARDMRWDLRFASFVEVMTPIFSREALRACIPTFEKAEAGFGVDNTWPKILTGAAGRSRIAIIDKVHAVHTRPAGLAYEGQAAIAEGGRLQWEYDAPSIVVEHGGVLKKPLDQQMD